MDNRRDIHIPIPCSTRFHMGNQSRSTWIATLRQMYFISCPPHGQLPPVGCLNIVGGADHFRWGRDILIRAKVWLAFDQFKLLHPNPSEYLYCWNMAEPVQLGSGENCIE